MEESLIKTLSPLVLAHSGDGNVTLHPDSAIDSSTTEVARRALGFPADEIKTLSPLVLAHIGDAYFHLYVRTRLLQVTHNITRLHELSAEIVSATAQAKTYHAIENFLTDDERDIFRRGRNAKSHAPRKATVAEYHASTGFEALLGELYLKKNFTRLDEICELAFKEASL
ncbi:MAG: hypothetical protein IJK81_12090 [Selenomonadaceae bacterium]|nr:hypothetical protein [Selenomonadaceae bacterium]